MRQRERIRKREHPGGAQETELLAELASLYRDADAAFEGWSCSTSTDCCRFGVTGREPYVTSIEVAALRRAVAALGGPGALRSATPRRSLPIAGATAEDERRCPLLTSDGRCAVYSARPLGCRTFYCDRASEGAPVRHKDILALVRRVQALGARHEPEGDLGRPLTRAFRSPG